MTDWTAQATIDADDEMRAQFNVDYDTFVANDVDSLGNAKNTYANEDAYTSARSAGWVAAYNEAYTDVLTSNSRESVSDVEVHGIGSDATVTSRDSSTFDVLIETTLNDPTTADATATANGAAGANLSTASFANQSVSTTASAFIQAFGGNQVGFVETDTTMGTNVGTGNVGEDGYASGAQTGSDAVNTAQAAAPSADNTESQVYQVFNDVLGIDPDANGLAYWTAELESGMDLDTFAENLANAK